MVRRPQKQRQTHLVIILNISRNKRRRRKNLFRKQNNNIELEQQKFREKKISENKILLKTECKKISVRYYLKEIENKM